MGVGRGDRETDTEKEEREREGARAVEEAIGTLQPRTRKDNVGSWDYHRWADELERLSGCLRSPDSGRLPRYFYSKATLAVKIPLF